MAYSFSASLVVDNTKVSGSSNHSNYPMYVKDTYDGTGTEPDLRTVANGGNIQNTDATGGASGSLTVPADFALFSDSDLTTQLDHEIVEYNASTGAITFRVRIPTLLYNSDTTIYVGYGDSAVTTSQENISGVWTDYVGVWHMNEASGTRYSATGSHDTDAESNMTTGTGNLYATCASFNGSSSYMTVPNNAELNITGGMTLMAWINPDSDSGWNRILSKGWEDGTLDPSILWSIEATQERQDFIYYDGSNYNDFFASSVDSYVEGSWQLFTFAYTYGTGSSADHRLDASSVSSSWVAQDGNGSVQTNTDKLRIGTGRTDISQWLTGDVQELRIASTQFSADYINTVHENESAPATFYAMGAETAAGGGGIAASKRIIQS